MDAGTSICETAEDLDARTVVLLSRSSRNPVQNMLFESANTYCVRFATVVTHPGLMLCCCSFSVSKESVLSACRSNSVFTAPCWVLVHHCI